MSAALFCEHCHHDCCVFGAGRNSQNGLFSQKCPQEVFASNKNCATSFPIGEKRHHTNQSQNYMANHVIWLLRNRGSCGRDGGGRVTVSATVRVIESDRDSEF